MSKIFFKLSDMNYVNKFAASVLLFLQFLNGTQLVLKSMRKKKQRKPQRGKEK